MIHLLADTESSGARNGRLGACAPAVARLRPPCEKARRARAAQWAKNGALFGKVNPATPTLTVPSSVLRPRASSAAFVSSRADSRRVQRRQQLWSKLVLLPGSYCVLRRRCE